MFEQLFEEVVTQCLAVGLVRGDRLSVDGTFVEANASKESRIPREQLPEAAQVNRTVREYLSELELQNPVEEPTHSQNIKRLVRFLSRPTMSLVPAASQREGRSRPKKAKVLVVLKSQNCPGFFNTHPC